MEREPRLIDTLFNQKNIEKSNACDHFFKNFTINELNQTTQEIITQFNKLNYTMISLKKKYLDTSQTVPF